MWFFKAENVRFYMKYSGTISRGVRTPIIKMGDDLASIVVDSVGKCIE